MSTLKEILNSLGSTSDEVAKNLQGIRGRRADPYQCPIARFLIGKGFQDVCVGKQIITAGEETCETTTSIHEFLVKFDDHGYRELSAPELIW